MAQAKKIDLSVDHWWRRVPARQWPHEAEQLATVPEALAPGLEGPAAGHSFGRASLR